MRRSQKPAACIEHWLPSSRAPLDVSKLLTTARSSRILRDQSNMDSSDDSQANPSEDQDLNQDEVTSEFSAGLEKFRVYLSYRTPTAIAMGGVTGGDF